MWLIWAYHWKYVFKKDATHQIQDGNIKTESLFESGRIIHDASFFFPPMFFNITALNLNVKELLIRLSIPLYF